MSTINFAGVEEQVVTKEEFPLEKSKSILQNKIIAVLGYGVQGPGQSLNLKDNGFNVIVGQRKNSPSWQKALNDGWEENVNLFSLEEATEKGDIILFLLSDAGQIAFWPTLKKSLNANKTLCFSHGFGITYKDQTNIIPPKEVDVVLVAPKGSGTSLRTLFQAGKGLNSSYAVFQNASGHATETVKALGIGVGSAFLFETTFQKEVYSDLTGERGILMGALAGLIEAQYHILRKNGHSPSEAFNETVEELTQSLVPLIAEKGMDWMFANTSTTAQRGALDWKNKFRDLNAPLFEELYKSVKAGKEAAIVIESCKQEDYRAKLNEELQEIKQSELWQTGEIIRKLRP